MLMSSPRHRPEDLELWAELEAADLVHYHNANVADKLRRSADVLASFVEVASCHAAISWGKDSTVLAHLVSCHNATWPPRKQIPLVWVKVDDLDVGCQEVRDCFLGLQPNPYHEIVVSAGKRTHKGTQGKREGFRQAEQLFGLRKFNGIRADESGVRKISAHKWGIETIHSCRPLLWWTAADIFAALAFLGLPVHQNYGMLGGGRYNRQQIRTAPLGGLRGTGIGRAEWEQEYYGDVLRRLEAGA